MSRRSKSDLNNSRGLVAVMEQKALEPDDNLTDEPTAIYGTEDLGHVVLVNRHGWPYTDGPRGPGEHLYPEATRLLTPSERRRVRQGKYEVLPLEDHYDFQELLPRYRKREDHGHTWMVDMIIAEMTGVASVQHR